jgi:hypothetical protein
MMRRMYGGKTSDYQSLGITFAIDEANHARLCISATDGLFKLREGRRKLTIAKRKSDHHIVVHMRADR